jgi:hypothetical protein
MQTQKTIIHLEKFIGIYIIIYNLGFQEKGFKLSNAFFIFTNQEMHAVIVQDQQRAENLSQSHFLSYGEALRI